MTDPNVRAIEVAIVRVVLTIVESLHALCLSTAPVAATILAGTTLRLRDEYPEIEEEEPEA